MILVDFYGAPETFADARDPVRLELSRLLRVRPESVVVRRIAVEGGPDEIELWVELSSEEQVYRRGREIAAALSNVVRAASSADVWVMFRIVPLSHAFLNGLPRARGRPSPEEVD